VGFAFFAIGCFDLACGRFSLAKAGIYLFGVPARIAAVLEILVGAASVYAVFNDWKKKGPRPDEESR
jgi:hypothetical protein